MSAFRHAIVRLPASSFAEGLSTANLGKPRLPKALDQHATYCAALERCGLELIRLSPDARYPDSTFVEDTAVVTARCAIITRPGAASRQGETTSVREALSHHCAIIESIEPPGTVDGGDICEAGDLFFVGISARTNQEGARQLASLLAKHGYTSALVDIRDIAGILHLKSGMSWLGEGRLALISALHNRSAFRDYERVPVADEQSYAANCIRVNDHVLIAAGYPRFAKSLHLLGYSPLALEMSEFQKMDGGLSCLSLRF